MKKRVAICMRGAVSLKDGPLKKCNKLYKNKNYVDYIKCRNSIFKFIVDKNENYDFDFFCHSWNTDLENDFINLYNPKLINCEDNNNFKNEIIEKCHRNEDFSTVSHALSLKKSIELKESYEKSHNFNYDIVITYRYDVLLWKDMNLEEYIFNDKNIYVNGHKNCNGDFHFIMSNKNSFDFRKLYEHLGTIPPKYHQCIKEFVLNVINKNLIKDKISPGKHQEVLRKIERYSISRGFLSMEMYESI